MKLDRKTRTKDLTAAVKQFCWAHGGYCWRNNNQPRIIKGAPVFVDHMSIGSPDLICAMPNGVTLWIEIKISPDKMRESQLAFQQEMGNRGHFYIVVYDTMDALIDVVEGLEKGAAK